MDGGGLAVSSDGRLGGTVDVEVGKGQYSSIYAADAPRKLGMGVDDSRINS